MWLTADIRRLTAEALNKVEGNLDLSLLLSLEAYSRQTSGESLRSLATGLSHSPFLETFLHGHEDFVREVAFSPNGTLLASNSADGTVVVWDVKRRQEIRPFPPVDKESPGDSRPLAFSPDGKWLVYSDDGCVRIWDVDLRAPVVHTIPCQPRTILSLALATTLRPSRSEATPRTLLASAWSGGPLGLWDTTDWTRLALPKTPGHTKVQSLAFNPSGNILAIGGNGGGEDCMTYSHRGPGGNDERRAVDECGCLTLVGVVERNVRAGPVCVPNDIVWSLDYHPKYSLLATAWRERCNRLSESAAI